MKRFLTFFSAITVFLFVITVSFASAAPIIFDNPLKSGDAMGLITSIVDQLFPLVIMILSLAIIYCAARYVIGVGSGSQAEATKWKKSLYLLIPAAILIAGAKTIIGAIKIFVQGI